MNYPEFQLTKALRALENAPESESAMNRARKWLAYQSNLNNNYLNIGSNKPVKRFPKWVTLEVLHGGFASGIAIAGGALTQYEQAKLESLKGLNQLSVKLSKVAKKRHFLNCYFLTDEGQEELLNLLETGEFQVKTPEESALLVITWLLKNKEYKKAKSLLKDISPFFGTLRFFPEPSSTVALSESKLSVSTVSNVIDSLCCIEPHQGLLLQKAAFNIWSPLADRALSLIIESYEGRLPVVRFRSDGSLESCIGGVPFAKSSEQWTKKRDVLLEDFSNASIKYKRTGRAKKKGSLGKMVYYLERHKCGALTSRERNQISTVVGLCIHKRGLPNSEKSHQFRLAQAQEVAAPLYSELSSGIVKLLKNYESHQGLESLNFLEKDTPDALRAKVARAELQTLDQLLTSEVVSSGEMLASLASQITSQLYAKIPEDIGLGRLLQANYYSFSKRRSLLLLNLGHQVTLADIPWFKAVCPNPNATIQSVALKTFKSLSQKNLWYFPYTQLPNKLLQELRSLSALANKKDYFTEELAADIFMGRLSPKFYSAAKCAYRNYKGSLYSKYYKIQNIDKDLVAQSRERLGLPILKTYSFGDVAQNGAVLEQVSILTSHNLTNLTQIIDFDSCQWIELCERCVAWIQRQPLLIDKGHFPRLKQHKNFAYAWRNLIFFLSMAREKDQNDWLERQLVSNYTGAHAELIHSLILGLNQCRKGENYKPFYGWKMNSYDR